jgi:uncharacterized protein (TIGR03067 family)
MNVGGMAIARPEANLTFKDNQMTFMGASGAYRTDAAKDPMQLDWTVRGGVGHWIFELHGDELTLAVMQGPDRPADFRPQAGKNVTTFRRLPQ